MTGIKSGSNIQARLEKVFGKGLEYVEAKIVLRLQPIASDAKGAVKYDPCNCVFARCATRMYQSTAAVFWKTSAYIDLIDEDGVRRVHRFRVSRKVYEEIVAFDHGKPLKLGQAFTLSPFSPSAHRAAVTAATGARNKTPRGAALHRLAHARYELNIANRQIERAVDVHKRVVSTTHVSSPKAVEAKKQVVALKARATKILGRVETFAEAVRQNPNGRINKERKPVDMSVRSGLVGTYNFSPKV
jgi:hypothetical protein